MNTEQLDIHPRIANAVQKAKQLKKFEAILSASGPELQRQTQLSAADVNALQEAAAKATPKLPSVTALQMSKGQCPVELKVEKLTTGCKTLDTFLRGGILNRGITEIAGESASGKTQLCLQLCLSVQLPKQLHGFDAGALYVCTEGVFPNKRLMQMVSIFSRKYSEVPDVQRKSFTDNIFIEHAADLDDLQFCITKKAPLLLSQGKVKLIVIDSIAALFRSEYGAKDAVKKAKQLSAIAAQLQQMARLHGASIVCVNQVTDVMDKTASQRVTPALGISWANLVTVRLMMTRTQQTVDIPLSPGNEVYKSPVRLLEVLFAPHLPNSQCLFVIDEDGVKGWIPS